MLAKKFDQGSQCQGLWDAGADLVKGRLVKLNEEKQVVYATNDDEAMGFCTLRVDTDEGSEVMDHDVIPKGKKPVIYTLVKHNEWRTTEVDGIESLKVGDKVTCGGEGKLAAGEGMFEVTEKHYMGDKPAVAVRIVK